MLTSGGRPGDMARCRELGITSYLLKPVPQGELLDVVMKALRLSRDRMLKPKPVAVPLTATATGLRVLLAEDNAVNQRLTVRLLEKQGHTVTVTENGRQALSALERQPFDLVLMDMQMPEMDGFEATARIRARERETGGRMPVIALTAHALKGDRERCLAAGMDAYVAKPIRGPELLRVMQEVIAPGETDGKSPVVLGAEVVDQAGALERVGGDRELLRELVALFCAECPKLLREVRDATAREHAADLRRAAHTLKGSVGNFGATAAVNAALELEMRGHEGNLAGAAAAVVRLETEIDRLLPALAELAGPDGLSENNREEAAVARL
jgi:CheY-like chemotaxis protein